MAKTKAETQTRYWNYNFNLQQEEFTKTRYKTGLIETVVNMSPEEVSRSKDLSCTSRRFITGGGGAGWVQTPA